MSSRSPELPDGTDHIVNGALETRPRETMTTAGTGPQGGSSGGAFIGAETGSSDGTGGNTAMRRQVREGAVQLKSKAGGKIREFAEEGKGRASSALDEISQAVSESAITIDERLGEQYGRYARQAADAVSGLADTLRNKDVDTLYDDAANVVRKSPAVAIGVAAAVGFALVRLVKAGALDSNTASPMDSGMDGSQPVPPTVRPVDQTVTTPGSSV